MIMHTVSSFYMVVKEESRTAALLMIVKLFPVQLVTIRL